MLIFDKISQICQNFAEFCEISINFFSGFSQNAATFQSFHGASTELSGIGKDRYQFRQSLHLASRPSFSARSSASRPSRRRPLFATVASAAQRSHACCGYPKQMPQMRKVLATPRKKCEVLRPSADSRDALSSTTSRIRSTYVYSNLYSNFWLLFGKLREARSRLVSKPNFASRYSFESS